ncbi:hypothetical protein FISHEDRAFT_51113 [Fistulina hepatica ATCC 64428]|uniref:Uncharacterized protein n=1 Tax=Fistulina hepatica ATCC 64428 TaxID=1128425 RepID=A0A0D7A2J2_9AGAR|nr:hypothetical protein FISHEDRAFT_51113 [Fistulina hepatica ATCC 64428]
MPISGGFKSVSSCSDESTNPYAPFTSKYDWQMAEWVKRNRGVTETALNELLQIVGDGKIPDALGLSFKNARELNRIIDQKLSSSRPRFCRQQVKLAGEVFNIYYRDVIACVRALFGDRMLGRYLVFAPEKHYTADDGQVRVFHNMHTGRWWWSTQKAVEAETPGATVIPVILSSDKTQLTLFRNKIAYPVYLSIGNIPKEVHRKPSYRAYILLAYLPTSKLSHIKSKAARRRANTNLYHACLRKILSPLKDAGLNGIPMTGFDGVTRRGHPVLSMAIDDYPEQVLTTGAKTGDCARCPTRKDELGDYRPARGPVLRDLALILDALQAFDDDPVHFFSVCKTANVKPVIQPFWQDLPYTNIYRCITPDILHQLYQGIVKHLVSWIISTFGEDEIDARCRRVPANHNIRVFMSGISTLSKVSGREHDQICRFLLGLVVDIPLPNGLSSARLVRAVRSFLDFLYLAQYPLHFALHYVSCIREVGTTDNCNTEYTERLHIDMAKDAYRASNKKDEFEQMTIWLERRDKVQDHAQLISWKLGGSVVPEPVGWLIPTMDAPRSLRMSKWPSATASIEVLTERYRAKDFSDALARYVLLTNDPSISTRHQLLKRKIRDMRIPISRLPVWHRIKFVRTDSVTGVISTVDSIHAQPARRDSLKRMLPARFDTALIHNGQGHSAVAPLSEYLIGRVCVIFSIPVHVVSKMFSPDATIPRHLAYIEWYTALSVPDPNHGMFKVSPRYTSTGDRLATIIPIVNIIRSAHLFPRFGPVAPVAWSSSNVLDLCRTFYLNPFVDKHFYRLLLISQETEDNAYSI